MARFSVISDDTFWLFFDTQQFPRALVDTKKFAYNKENEIKLNVDLTIKGITKSVPLTLKVILLAEELVQLKGIVKFSRTAFQIGVKEWSSTAILRDKVSIKTNLFLVKE